MADLGGGLSPLVSNTLQSPQTLWAEPLVGARGGGVAPGKFGTRKHDQSMKHRRKAAPKSTNKHRVQF